jgi:hypothetical protein
MRVTALALLLLAGVSPAPAGNPITPGKPVDYSRLAFYPERWKQQGLELELVPWKGREITFLTVAGDLDPGTMTRFVGHLDAGWRLYAGLTGHQPRKHRAVDGLPTIAAVPGGGLTCGYGCGYVGATGIEMTHFYDGHYPALRKSPDAVPHAYFYEMGRNYYTFGRKHDAFTTGFAVFMRYVCVDTLELEDGDTGTRRTIDEAITAYEQTDLPFLRTFTNADGLSEKQNRLETSPTDQPVMYASAMLRLRETHGDEWLKKFYRQLATCPDADSRTREGARAQCFHWFLAASCAAGKDLSPTFIKAWRFEPTPEQAAILRKIDWSAPGLEAGRIARPGS